MFVIVMVPGSLNEWPGIDARLQQSPAKKSIPGPGTDWSAFVEGTGHISDTSLPFSNAVISPNEPPQSCCFAAL